MNIEIDDILYDKIVKLELFRDYSNKNMTIKEKIEDAIKFYIEKYEDFILPEKGTGGNYGGGYGNV